MLFVFRAVQLTADPGGMGIARQLVRDAASQARLTPIESGSLW